LDENQRLLGLVTDGDLRRMLERITDIAGVQATHIMIAHPKTIGPDELAVNALALLREHAITQLVVMDGPQYLGMVHLHDLVREGLL
jgi:arabinose-5-phosphate isomerase